MITPTAAGRRLRRAVRRVVRGHARLGALPRQVVSRGAAAFKVLAGRGRLRGLFVISSYADGGSFLSGVVPRIQGALADGVPVEVLELDFSPSAPAVELQPDVSVHRFWEDMVSGAACQMSPDVMRASAKTPAFLADRTRAPGFYSDGLPSYAVVKTEAGTRVAYYSSNGVHTHTHEFDHEGVFVRIVDLDPATGKEVTHRYVDSDGWCWLSVSIDADGQPTSSFQMLPRAMRWPDLASIQARWVRRRLGRTLRPVVLATGPASSRVMSRAGFGVRC